MSNSNITLISTRMLTMGTPTLTVLRSLHWHNLWRTVRCFPITLISLPFNEMNMMRWKFWLWFTQPAGAENGTMVHLNLCAFVFLSSYDGEMIHTVGNYLCVRTDSWGGKWTNVCCSLPETFPSWVVMISFTWRLLTEGENLSARCLLSSHRAWVKSLWDTWSVVIVSHSDI